MSKKLIPTAVLLLFSFLTYAQATERNPCDSVMITVFLKHQQDKNLEALQEIQIKNKFEQQFPPKTANVVSWYVMMGIGQVVTLKLPASELRTLNLSIEKGAWGAFTTEFYSTYDFQPIRSKNLINNKAKK